MMNKNDIKNNSSMTNLLIIKFYRIDYDRICRSSS